ncbi:sugar transferase [Dactylosporangium roseum]|uniref:Sugar transferase n=1 Tax=Dactylosporangium roseum TaxID=47989 RepID=A0ABY5Z8F4_9ACTN|nr:sugar transferase [Dactylosporangium roseum]UWZ37107.1 sugar transferase [Dactylosporangium roseum]
MIYEILNYWILLVTLFLALLPAVVLTSSFSQPARAWACRLAFVVTVGLIVAPWVWLHLGHDVPARAALILVTAAFASGIVLSAATAGIVEDNAPPSAEVQREVLAYHSAVVVRLRPAPRGKRLIDVIGALLGLALTLPLWPIIGLLVWFEEPGPVFFTKNSVGRGGATFRQFKFRSMEYGAERLTGPVASPAGDPRTLRVGRWLRRWHLDELPELINVLGGTMSLVGPRPLRTVLVRTHLQTVPGYAERHTVRPGIACIAQIEKFHMSPQERLEKDLAYIEHQSVRLDLRLLIRAALTTVRGERRYDETLPAPVIPTVPAPAQAPEPQDQELVQPTGRADVSRSPRDGPGAGPAPPAARPTAGSR